MKINLKRLMSLAMAMVMVVQMLPLNAFAADDEVTPTPAPTETVAPSTEPTTEPETSTEPTVIPTETTEPAVEPEETVEPSVEPTETVEPTVETTETTKPAEDTADTVETPAPHVHTADENYKVDAAEGPWGVDFYKCAGETCFAMVDINGNVLQAEAGVETIENAINVYKKVGESWTLLDSNSGSTVPYLGINLGESVELKFDSQDDGTGVAVTTPTELNDFATITSSGNELTLSFNKNKTCNTTFNFTVGDNTIPVTISIFGTPTTDGSGDGTDNGDGGDTTDPEETLVVLFQDWPGNDYLNTASFDGTTFTKSGVKKGQTVQFKFEKNNTVLRATTTATSVEGGYNFTADTTNNTYSIEFLAEGEFELPFTVEGTEYKVKFIADDNSNLLFTRDDPATIANVTWSPLKQTANMMASTTLQKDEKIYFKLTKNYDMVSAKIEESGNSRGEVSFGKENYNGEYYFVITGGSKNGYISLNVSCEMGPDSNKTMQNVCSLNLTVQGNKDLGDATSFFKDKEIKQSFANSGIVEFDVTGELTEGGDIGYTYADGKIYFDTTNKTPGAYVATAGGKGYAVAVMPEISQTAETNSEYYHMVDDENIEETWKLPVSAPNDLFKGELRISAASESMGGTFTFNEEGEYYPLYIYRVVKDGEYKLASMKDYKIDFDGKGTTENEFFYTTHTQVNGVDVIKVVIKDNIFKSIPLTAQFTINDPNEKFVELMRINNGPPAMFSSKISFAEEKHAAKIPAGTFAGELSYAYSVEIGQDPHEYNIYLVKKSGDPVQYAFPLYEEVILSSLSVTSTNPSVVKVDSYIGSIEGENAIGIKLKILDTSDAWREEIKVEFNSSGNNNLPHYKLTLPITCGEINKAETKEAGSVDEFIAMNESMTGGFIYLEAGTYEMDVYRNRGNKIFAAEGAEGKVFITGDPNNNGPIIVLGSDDEGIDGIVIDGGGKRDGIYTNGQNLNVSSSIIRNCPVAIKETTEMSKGFMVMNTLFEKNGVAIESNLRNLSVKECEFKENTTAIKVSGATYNAFEIIYSKFINNTKDLDMSSDHDGLYIMQNYFEKEGTSISPKQAYAMEQGRIGKVYYSPFYTKSDLSELSADINGAIKYKETAEETNISIPVNTTNVATSVIDNAVFVEMQEKAAAGVSVTAELSVKEKVGEETKDTAIWSFNNEEGNLLAATDKTRTTATMPEKMDLKVTDTLSTEAQTIVNNKVSNTGDIVQYVNFSHEGTLPGKATVKVLKTADVTKENLKLYYINETTGTVETAQICDVTEIQENGNTYFVVTVDHCSEYIISTGVTLKQESTDNAGTTDNAGSAGGTTSTTTATPAATATPAPTKAPATANDLVSTVEIEDKFEDTTDDTVVIDITDKELVSSKLFEILAENPDKTVVLEGDGFRWEFAASDITEVNAIPSTTFNPTISLTSPNADEVEAAAGTENIINVYFSYHGDLPGKATVTVNVGPQHAGKTMYLYYYNATTGEIEYIRMVEIAANGNATFDILHCSDYFLSPTKLHSDDEAADNTQDVEIAPPATDDTQAPAKSSMGMLPLLVVIAAGVIVAVALMAKKKKAE